uniref:NAD(P)/FAD-dependent oxidoreductase n=1 Tax=Pararhizobium sp. IMCC3301 TaxID=3067904 RepID=UPI002741767F|nr:FAD-binding oxidoreductase [Pararhizobium sp. IMCC3301]
MQHQKPEIETAIIIGGGIFGVSTAAQLVRMGVRVTLLNDGPLGTGASGRSLAWLNSARRRSPPYHAIRQAGMERYRSLASRNPGVNWLKFDGGLTWDADDSANEIAQIYRYERELGYEAELLSPQEVSARVAGVAGKAVTAQGAILNPGEGWVDLPTLIQILAADITKAGGTIITNEGQAELIVENGRATGAATAAGQSYRADAVLVAAGASGPAILAPHGVHIGDDTPIALLVETKPVSHPLRAVLNTPRIAIRPALNGAFFMDSAWSEEEVVVHEDGSFEAKPETVQGMLDAARKVLDPVPELEVAAIHIGPKPIPGDGDPVFGQVQALPGCFIAFSHSGATQGLIAGELLGEEIAYGIRHPMLQHFRPERFNT